MDKGRKNTRSGDASDKLFECTNLDFADMLYMLYFSIKVSIGSKDTLFGTDMNFYPISSVLLQVSLFSYFVL